MQQYTDLQKNVESVEREKTEAGIAYEQKIKELRQRLTDSSNKITVLKVFLQFIVFCCCCVFCCLFVCCCLLLLFFLLFFYKGQHTKSNF